MKTFTRFKNAQTPQEETRYLFALANFRLAGIDRPNSGSTINGEVRTQNSPYLMRGILSNATAQLRRGVS